MQDDIDDIDGIMIGPPEAVGESGDLLVEMTSREVSMVDPDTRKEVYHGWPPESSPQGPTFGWGREYGENYPRIFGHD